MTSSHPSIIYHMAHEAEWHAAQASGAPYMGSPDDRRDGFIHFSTAAQVKVSAAKHRAGQKDLLLLTVEAKTLGPALKWESSRGGDLFPHLYGALPAAAVIKVAPLPLGPDGVHVFPPLATHDRPAASFDIYGRAAQWLRCLAPEVAHHLTLCLLETGLFPWRDAPPDDPAALAVSLWGKNFANPIGLAAGFDKDARVVPAMERFGFGFIEVGGLTPKPQPGNPRPRLFRLTEDQALINRLGFNNQGVAAAAMRLTEMRRYKEIRRPLAVNIGCNKNTPDPIGDYVTVFTQVAPLVDFAVINVSSPNTPGLRDLQGETQLRAILTALRQVKLAKPILIKIAPDLSRETLDGILSVATSSEGADGLVISNTTVDRPAFLRGSQTSQTGGLSGTPLFAPSTDLLRTVYRETKGRLPLIGVGGIASGADAYAKIRAGASLVQLYTALVYQGPGLVQRLKSEVSALLARDGFASVTQAIGVDAG